MKLEKVAVLGAGAVGAYVLWGLSEKPGIRLGVVAEGERARRLKNGIGINGKAYHPEVWTPEEAHGTDLLVVALKYGALPGALDSIRQVVGEHTIVMSLMNGVDSEEIIAAEVGADHLLYSLIKVVSHKEADGFRFDPDTTLGIIYGELAAPFESERVCKSWNRSVDCKSYNQFRLQFPACRNVLPRADRLTLPRNTPSESHSHRNR